jgi:hypothetical protein
MPVENIALDANRANVGYSPEGEEIPMTLQIAMIAKDGWLIASDMCRTLAMRMRTASLTTKIVIGSARDLAYAFAGDDCAILAGIELERQYSQMPLDNLDLLRSALETLGNASWQKAKRGLPMPPHPGPNRSLLIGFAGGTFPLWDLRIGEDRSIAYNVADKIAVAGDDTSPALFFAERYYNSNLTVEALMPLAAHIILTGAHFSEYVRELEMVVYKAGQFTTHRRGSDLLRRLTENSNKIDEQIRNMILDSSIILR